MSETARVVGCNSNPTLMIPESKLIWQGRNRGGMGSLMLAFRATAVATSGQKTSSSKKPPLQCSLAKVSVNLNKISHSDIVQLAKPKQASAQQVPSQTSSHLSPESTPIDSDTTQRTTDSRQTAESDKSTIGYSTAVKSCLMDTTPSSEANPPRVFRKAKSKNKEKRDASTMTDLSFGTGIATTPLVYPCNGSLEHTPKEKETHPLNKGNESYASSALLYKLSALKNGTLNGVNLPNGFADAAQHYSNKSNSSKPDFPSRNDHLCQDTEDEVFLEATEPECSLTVSIPCTYHNSSNNSSAVNLDSEAGLLNARRKYKVPNRKRSEIQLLLDGDKPPGERISAEEVPVFMAEDPSSRATRSSSGTSLQQVKGSWTQLGTGTRKVTPVEPFTYPVTPKKTGMVDGQGHKRVHPSDPPSFSDEASPPLKLARLEEEREDLVEEEEEEESGRNIELEDENYDHEMSKSHPPASSASSSHSANSKHQASEREGSSTPISLCPEGVFCAEIVVFDSRGECLLQEGDYSILMQKSLDISKDSPAPLATFAPLTWDSVFGDESRAQVTVPTYVSMYTTYLRIISMVFQDCILNCLLVGGKCVVNI